MKKLLIFSLLALILQSCGAGIDGNGNVQEKEHDVEEFDRIEVSGNFEIYVRSANKSSLVVVADENLHDYIEVEVKRGILYVDTKERLGHFEKLELLVDMERFEGAKISGAGTLKSKGILIGDEVEIDFSGAVDADLKLECRELDFDMSGAAEISLSGVAQKASFDISGAGNISAAEFETERCRIEISGAGEALVYASEELQIDISGAGEVRYAGNPKEIKREVSGAASVKPL